MIKMLTPNATYTIKNTNLALQAISQDTLKDLNKSFLVDASHVRHPYEVVVCFTITDNGRLMLGEYYTEDLKNHKRKRWQIEPVPTQWTIDDLQPVKLTEKTINIENWAKIPLDNLV